MITATDIHTHTGESLKMCFSDLRNLKLQNLIFENLTQKQRIMKWVRESINKPINQAKFLTNIYMIFEVIEMR